MSESNSVLLVMVGTAVVILLAGITTALMMALFEVRATARAVRETLERLGPKAEEALDNIREVSESAARATSALTRIGERVASIGGAARPGPWAAAAAAIAGFYTAYKRRKAAASGDASK